VPELRKLRPVDPADGGGSFGASFGHDPCCGIEATILECLITAYPLPPGMEEVDARFRHLLDAIADLDLDPALRG
jgi:hypothetical protein